MKPKGTSFQCTSKCTHFHPFSYGHAIKSSKKRPTTNAPFPCLICHPDELRARKSDIVEGVWTLNFDYHMRTRHPDYARPSDPSGKTLPPKMAEALRRVLSPEELLAVLGKAACEALPLRATWSEIADHSISEPSHTA
jgi:hypothetical protein